ncbi:DUF1206 domain-containing protein [Williamsia deligens]|uniref:DUF1206 domain-containing protein n=1 Tax=Williamsia deligens TaxID=321325 RepID=A0ABW3G4H0_9NOCA|nr:DUF1206 domain-containing protein [Williamsia deligens]MCP2193729.1 protein of unknown function (DUF1206) [Williamsia deligens]
MAGNADRPSSRNPFTAAVDHATDSSWFEAAARAGHVVSGIVHVLIAYVIVRIAVGAGGNADQSGALATVGGTTGGTTALYAGAVAFVAMALWRLAEAAIGVHATEPDDPDDDGPSALLDRGKALSLAVIYLAFAWTAARFAFGDHSSSGSENAGMSARLMDSTLGVCALIAVGVIVVCVGAYHVHKGVTRAFLDDLTITDVAVVRVTGLVGYTAKGLVLALAGVLLVVAALRSDPSKATGLDGAVKTLGSAPAGPSVLLIAAVGLATYGVYAFVMARFARM